jgi:uncharacterized low-complexity protein
MAIKSNVVRPVAAAIGVAFVSSLVVSTSISADDNPFSAADLDTGYMLAAHHEKDEEGKCGEGKCGEGKCGEDKGEEGSCGEEKGEEGSCGEEKGEEGSCGEEKGEEGSCGEEKGEEGSCGGA